MKLLVLAPQPFFQNRGTPIATLKMLHVLADDGHEIDLLTFHEGTDIDLPGVRHLRIPTIPFTQGVPPGFSWRKLACDTAMAGKVLRLCWRNHYDVIHAVEESVFMAMLVKWTLGVPYIYDMDSSLPRQISDQLPPLRMALPLLRFCERQAVRQSRGVVAVCQSLEDVAASHSSDVPIVRIEDASLLTQEPAADTPQVLALDGPIIMYVGNLQTYQGIELLLDAFTHIYHQYHRAQLVIIGGAQPEIQLHRHYAQRNGVLDRTHFLGPRPVDQLREYLQQADVLVSPRTLGTNTPMKIFSYLESGTPVLATALTMHTQVLDSEIAMLVDATPLEMARGIAALLDDYRLGMRLSAAAQQRMQTRFRPDVLDLKLSEFYQEIASTLGCETPTR
ncbi:glycosyltransferase [Moorena producens 3L]|uniref:Glycosyltransferase n=1 Tax=Moorena producens 3L TaxID=489825 RepID=F4XR98_9CYAN|nr:glycosyltransferase family 4 protein [Moorena producens]EGJ32885.1 glycosyltransferase [Moorena producens 3L]OLT55156.1 hypothetical protein BI334_32780 [Moorena producens 3L]